LELPDTKMKNSYHYSAEEEVYDEALPPQKKVWWEFLKSQKRKEREKRERLEREAELINQRNENRINEQIRQRQEARQAASSDMIEIQNRLIATVNQGIDEKFDRLIEFFLQLDGQNQQAYQDGQRKLQELAEYRKQIDQLESEASFN
jgi:hypothetical protein